MTTHSDVRCIVRPLLDRQPDIALVRRAIVLKPVHHLLRGVVLGGSSMKELFIVHSAVIHLLEPKTSFSLSWGRRIYRANAPLWTIDDPGMAEELLAVIEQDLLPMLRPIATIDDFIAYTADENLSQNRIGQHPMDHTILEAARGDFDAASAICDKISSPRWREWFACLAPDDFQRVMYELRPLLMAQDRIGVVQLLRKWESESVKNLKLEKLWERSPLPIELDDAEQR